MVIYFSLAALNRTCYVLTTNMQNFTKLLISIALFQLHISHANAQLGQSERHVQMLLGAPIKKHRQNVPIPTNIYIKNEIQAQISFHNGTSNGAVYHKAALKNGAKQPLNDTDISIILIWNKLKPQDLERTGEGNGKVLYVDKMKKHMIIHDKKSHMYTVLDHDEAIKMLAR